jgi:hypothetical protein
MSTATAAYTIEWDAEAGLFLVLDADGQHAGDGETRAEAEAEMAKLMTEDLRAEVERLVWDADLAALLKIKALF